jgi:hypothetical protein
MKEVLIPPCEVDFICGSSLHHGAGLTLTGPWSCDISFSKLWNGERTTKMSGCACDWTCLQQINLNHWIKQLSKLITENLPYPAPVLPGALLDVTCLGIMECYS